MRVRGTHWLGCAVTMMVVGCIDVELRHHGRPGTHHAPATMGEPTASSDCPELQIELPGGSIAGKQQGDTREFLGIPYGRAPIGELRFAPPQPADAWQGTRDATVFGPACPQPSTLLASTGPQDEDCLNLDVYTPLSVAEPLPVMVFIHGGAYVTGASSQYDGRLLSESQRVVVTLNYRLGALGFFSSAALDATREGSRSGSDGIRDQQLALRWVQDNIALFGGDPTNVSVFGESAGAISACIHYVAPSSQGLASRYILESGTCTADGLGPITKQSANAISQGLLDALCADEDDPLACLRARPAEELVGWAFEQYQFGPGWNATIEGIDGVLPDYPERLIGVADTLAPLIIGTNQNEWGLYEQLGYTTPTDLASFQSTVAGVFGALSGLVLARYPVEQDAQANTVYVQLVSDVTYRCPTRSVAALASGRGAPVYMYSFEQGTALHAQELDYVLGGDAQTQWGSGPPSQPLQAAVQRYWTRFAQNGDPNGDDDPTWPRYLNDDEQYLKLVDPPSASTGLAHDACEFWRDYFLQGGTIYLY